MRGKLKHNMGSKNLKKEIFNLVAEYYTEKHKPKPFIPGETYIQYAGRVYDEKEMISLVDSALDFWLTAGRFAKQFEEEFTKFLGAKHCILTNSGSSANLLAISALTSPKLGERRLKSGDEVITTACAFPTTVNPIIQNNLIPVFIDVDVGTYNIQADKIEEAVSDKTKAIFLAHTLGNPFDIDKIQKIVKKYDLWLIEDNCIDGNRCSVVRIDGKIQVLTIKEIYNAFHDNKYKTFEILSHGETFKEDNINNLSDEFVNTLSKRQLSIVKLYKRYRGYTNKIITELGITRSSYYCSMWEIRRKIKNFIGIKYKWAIVRDVIFKNAQDVLNITQNFGQTSITKDHRLIIFQNEQLNDSYTDDFVSNKNIFINILLPENNKEDSVDLAKYLEGYTQNNGSIKFDDNWIWFEYNKKCWKGKMLELPKIKRNYKGSDLEILCTLFGLYCSEGSCGHELRFSSTDYEDIKLIGKYIKSISNLKSIRISTDDDRSYFKIIRGKKFKNNKIVFSVNMGHELINIIFSALGGTDSYNKRVPNFIFNLNKKYMKVFYDFYIKGDGCRKSDDEVDFVVTTASTKMASGINLLNNLIFKKYSRLVITKNKYYDISPVKSLKYIKKKVNKVKNIENVEVYDIVVDNTSTFVDACGNILLHNCDALGSKYDEKYTGTFGHIATFSFYPAHHITMGEGGALVTNDSELKRLIKSFRDWGRDCWCEPGCDNTCDKRFGLQLGSLPFGYDHKYIYSHIGYNLKITDMQAAVGVEQIKKLPLFTEARKKNFKLLYEGLKKYEKYFILPEAESKADPSWFGFLLTVRKDAGFTRDDIIKYLEDNKIATRMLFAGNITRHPSFENTEYRIYGDLKNTDFIMNNTFWIGVYPGFTLEIINYILEIIDEFFKNIK